MFSPVPMGEAPKAGAVSRFTLRRVRVLCFGAFGFAVLLASTAAWILTSDDDARAALAFDAGGAGDAVGDDARLIRVESGFSPRADADDAEFIF